MKYTIGFNKNWAESFAVGAVAGIACLIIIPVMILLLGLMVVVFPVAGAASMITRDYSEDKKEPKGEN